MSLTSTTSLRHLRSTHLRRVITKNQLAAVKTVARLLIPKMHLCSKKFVHQDFKKFEPRQDRQTERLNSLPRRIRSENNGDSETIV